MHRCLKIFRYGFLIFCSISDDLVDDMLTGITEEVSEVVGHYVETLYASEFDVKTWEYFGTREILKDKVLLTDTIGF